MFNRYNTRNSRYSTSNQFVSPGDPSGQAKTYNVDMQQQQPNMPFNKPTAVEPPPPSQSFLNMSPKIESVETEDFKNEQDIDEPGSVDNANAERPPWMKSKLQGVKKISNRERRRRQNESLRRLLSPKNALMVLNEIMPGENNFKVEPVPQEGQYFKQNSSNFCADLAFEGNTYKGYGENKMAARNAAAEQAVRDLLLRRMTTALAASDEGQNGGPEPVEEDLPMIQLASFALHKLFAEWEVQGHRVPTLRPQSSVSESSAPLSAVGSAAAPASAARPAPRPAPRALPADADQMHPCMLLAQMRPGLSYRETAALGDKPQNMLFTMELDVDGQTFSGRAGNKREARKAAARAACRDLFGVSSTEPQ